MVWVDVVLLFGLYTNRLGNRFELTFARCAANYKEVGNQRDISEVEEQDVLTFAALDQVNKITR